jgi:hypothetical protein
MNLKRLTAFIGTMNHAKTPFSTEICAGVIISVVQYFAPLRYAACAGGEVVPSRLTTYYAYVAALHLRQQLGAGKAMPEYKPAKPHCTPVLMVWTLAPRPKGRVASAWEHVV